jgi:hypothetical protein
VLLPLLLLLLLPPLLLLPLLLLACGFGSGVFSSATIMSDLIDSSAPRLRDCPAGQGLP